MRITATEFNRRSGECLDKAQKEPVTIEKKGTPFAVVISQEAFEAYENAYWLTKALEAEKEGYLSVKETKKLFSKLLGKSGA